MTSIESIDAPAWCRWRPGRGAVLVIAPHGGRRDPVPPRPPPRGDAARTRRVNDLHTADLAEQLADALGAGLIVNPTLDRNRLDLNRISQVTTRATWFLVLIEALVDEILSRHPRAELLFVHGWNVIQPRCDIGIGQTLPDAFGAHACAEPLTVSPAYATERLGSLQSHCAAAGIATSFGERYPGRHPNNLLQLFRQPRPGPQTPPRLAEWTATGRIEAVQLELGVPVRWPGRYRNEFLTAAAASFDGAGPAATRSDSARRSTRDRSPVTGHARPARSASLQLYDPAADIALTARLDAMDAPSAGRLLVFVGARRLALFIGEDVSERRPFSEGPHFTPAPAGFRLRFEGPALAGEDGGLYRDLEQAFAASQLCAVAVDLSFRRTLCDDYGVAEGWVALDGRRHDISTHAFARHGVLSGTPSNGWTSQVVLSAGFGAAAALRLRHEFPGAGEQRLVSAAGEVVAALPPLTIAFDRDRFSPTRIVVGDGTLVCEPRTRMAIVRPLLPHRQARVTFGAARFTRAGREGFGFYEYARAVV